MDQVHELGRIAAAIRKLQHDYTWQRLIGLREMCEENADSLLPLDAKREFVKIFEKYVRTRDHISELGDILREALMERERNEVDAKQKVIQTKLSVCYDKGYESEGEAERYPGFNRKGKSTNTNNTKPAAASKQPAQPQKRKHETTKPTNKKKQASQKNEKSVKPQPQPRLQRHNPPPSRNVDPRIKRDSPSDSSPSGSSYSKSEDEAPRKHPKTNTSSALPSRPFNRAEHGWPLVKAETLESEDEEPHRKKSKHNARRR
ncbi:hypothetical protein B0J14DRAFT_373196 [Halenospora varia]|nr:hypothetical protein B0J14DRAFT_373196 [Halenospora varia]